jgi:hypothetical protein
MHLGKAGPLKLAWSRRRIRLGVAHHGAPSSWVAPVKDQGTRKAPKKRR